MNSEKIYDKLRRIVNNYAMIYIRVCHKGRLQSVSLAEATNKQVANWLSDILEEMEFE